MLLQYIQQNFTDFVLTAACRMCQNALLEEAWRGSINIKCSCAYFELFAWSVSALLQFRASQLSNRVQHSGFIRLSGHNTDISSHCIHNDMAAVQRPSLHVGLHRRCYSHLVFGKKRPTRFKRSSNRPEFRGLLRG
jgi:hypothetical protein